MVTESLSSLQALAGYPLEPRWEGKRDYRIAMIGVGGVANSCHLPAYRSASFNVIAAADINPQALQRARQQWGIERLYHDYNEMIERERPDIVDITIHDRWADEKLRAVEAAAASGVHVLIQKPLAGSFDQCAAMVAAAHRGRIKMAVNQNARWAPAFYAGHQIARSGVLGKLVAINLEFRNAQRNRPILYTFCVHSFDLLRWWIGREPQTIFAARTYPDTGQRFVSATVDFGDGLLACVWDDWTTHRSEWWRFRIVGTEGMLVANEYWGGDMEPPWVEVYRPDAPGYVFRPRLTYRYQPTAFISSMRDLMQAIEHDTEPVVSGDDNLKTMQMIFAAHLSAEQQIAVKVATVGTGARVG